MHAWRRFHGSGNVPYKTALCCIFIEGARPFSLEYAHRQHLVSCAAVLHSHECTVLRCLR